MNFFYGFVLGILTLPGAILAWHFIVALSNWPRQRRLARGQKALDEACPTWRNTVNSRGFREWLRTQPAETLDFADSWDAKESLEVLRRYEQSR